MELKRILALAAISLLVFAGCGGPNVGVTSEEIKIGTWAPLTGPASNLSTIAKAMDAYFAYINDQGGIHGRKLTLIMKDDGYDPARTPGVVEELVDGEHVFALLGGSGTANCLAVKDYIAIKLLPWINPGSAARVWTSPVNAYVFSTFPSYVTEGRILAKYVLDEIEADKYGMFYQDDSFGREGQEGVRLGLRSADKEIALERSRTRWGRMTLPRSLRNSKTKKWTSSSFGASRKVLLPSSKPLPRSRTTTLKSWPRKSSRIRSCSISLATRGKVPSSLRACPRRRPTSPAPIKAREIIEQYGNGMEFGTYAYWGLARAEILVEGLERAGPDLTRLKFILAIEGIDDWTDNFVGTSISFSAENHQGLNAIHLSKADGGTLVHLSEWLES